MPDGKRVTLSVKVSEDMAGAVDAARGAQSRSEWLQSAILTMLRRDAGRLVLEAARAESPRRLVAPAKFSAPRDGEPPPGITGPGAVPQRRARRDEACPHPKARVIKKFCGACGTYVG